MRLTARTVSCSLGMSADTLTSFRPHLQGDGDYVGEEGMPYFPTVSATRLLYVASTLSSTATLITSSFEKSCSITVRGVRRPGPTSWKQKTATECAIWKRSGNVNFLAVASAIQGKTHLPRKLPRRSLRRFQPGHRESRPPLPHFQLNLVLQHGD